MSRVVVIGGGVGGLTAAIRLVGLGHDVTLLERRDVLGGKLATLHDAGYTFDIGPSLVTLPHVFDEVFASAGTSLADEVDLVRLDPQFRYHWRDGASLTVRDDPERTAAAFDGFTPGAGDAWRRFDARGRRIWDVSVRTFFAGPMSDPWSLARRMRSPLDLVAIDPLRSLHHVARRSFDDPRLQQWVGRYATYSGSSPYRAPATLACIPHVEARYGAWYPIGGLGVLRDALERVARRAGVEVRCNAEVTRLLDRSGAVTGVELDDGERIDADVVVANCDAEHLTRDLLDDRAAYRRVRRARRSTSGFVVCVGARGPTPRVDRGDGRDAEGAPAVIGHHTVWFSGDYRREFDDLAAGRFPDDPTVYACVSSVTDPSQAPEGGENWFLLVNTASGIHVDREAATDVVLGALERHGVELRSRAEVLHTLTPADLAERYRAPGGAIYGTSSDGRRAAFRRPANRGPRRGLYLVGGSSHPGGGLPLVTMSGGIVAGMIGPA